MISTPSRYDLSVVIATRNPNPHILSWALDSLSSQTMDPSRFEVVIVDNGSTPPVSSLQLCEGRRYALRTVVELQAGTTAARVRGIREATAQWIVFLDDDNYIDPDYLEEAARIAAANPHIGAFGGVARFLCDRREPGWLTPLLPYLGIRDYGTEVVTSTENKWGHWEPIGAGMVFRKEIGEAFLRTVETNPLARRLGRSATSHISGEDSLIARSGYALGYACSYQPSLRLTHFIRASRLDVLPLARTIQGIAEAWVLCETVLGTSVFPPLSRRNAVRELVGRLRGRLRRSHWKTAVVEWSWDVGWVRQMRALTRSGVL